MGDYYQVDLTRAWQHRQRRIAGSGSLAVEPYLG